MTALYPPDWAPRGRGVSGGRDPVTDGVLLLMRVSSKVGRDGGGYPVAVHGSHGAHGTITQWDAYTSACDARALICLANGDTPDPASGLAIVPPGVDVNSVEYRTRVRRTWPRSVE